MQCAVWITKGSVLVSFAPRVSPWERGCRPSNVPAGIPPSTIEWAILLSSMAHPYDIIPTWQLSDNVALINCWFYSNVVVVVVVSFQATCWLYIDSCCCCVTIAVESRFNELRSSPKSFSKVFWGLTGFEPVASAFALQWSTSWVMKTHTLGLHSSAGSAQLVVVVVVVLHWSRPWPVDCCTWITKQSHTIPQSGFHIFHVHFKLALCFFLQVKKGHDELNAKTLVVLLSLVQQIAFLNYWLS